MNYVTSETTVKNRELDHKHQLMPKNKLEMKLHTRTKSRESYDKVRDKNEGWLMSRVRDWEKNVGFVTPIKWLDALVIISFHVTVVISGAVYLFPSGFLPMWQTVIFSYLMGQIAGFGVTGGAHRYWCHRSFKAKTPLRIILILCFSVAGQNNMYQWVRDHRVHHKFSETSADPHDAKRGFFFSHIGWLMMKKHPDVILEGRKVDMSDIANDPLISFHTKYFLVFKVLLCFIIPILIPMAFWGECWQVALFSQALRYMMSLNITWSVNSFAHLYGDKPYNSDIMPSENWGVSMFAMGEGWHNYHHTFPWDYKAAELAFPYNATTTLLDWFASIGWAYDLKVASPSLIDMVAKKKGDPSCRKLHQH